MLCTLCNEDKEVGAFYASTISKSGTGQCKECTRARVKKYRAQNIDQVRERDRRRHWENPERREYSHRQSGEWHRLNKSRSTEIKKSWIERNREKRAAHIIVGNAIRDGKLARGQCERCGADQAHAHHDNYSRPLDVRWLCVRCHSSEHVLAREAMR